MAATGKKEKWIQVATELFHTKGIYSKSLKDIV